MEGGSTRGIAPGATSANYMQLHISALWLLSNKNESPSSPYDSKFADLPASTLYATMGRRMPLIANSPTNSAFTIFSTAISTRALTKIWPGVASSQRRDATLETVPIAVKAPLESDGSQR